MTPTADQRRSRPTIRDVAALSGASLKTVSRVVNGEPGVSDDLAERVRAAIAQLGYRHNLSASNLRRSNGKTASIGLLVGNIANPFSAAVHRAVEDVARRHGVAVLAGSLDEDHERERELVAAFSLRRVDGLIVMPAIGDQSYLADERRAGTAMVFVDRPPTFFDADTVLADNREGAATATAHLADHGHRRIAYLGDLQLISTAAERFQGYTDIVIRRGLDEHPDLVVHDLHDVDLAESATHALMQLADPPTALFCSQNLVTIGAIRSLRRLGLNRETALVGFDDFPLADLLEPAVTVVAQFPAEIGRIAAEELFRRLGGDTTPTRRHIVPTALIERGSGEIAPLG
jgi:LacI family transcriptional regulator